MATRNHRTTLDQLSHLANVASDGQHSKPPRVKKSEEDHSHSTSKDGRNDGAVLQGGGFSFPLLQRGGLTDEQLAAIQQSLALPMQDVSAVKHAVEGDIPSFGVEIPNQTLTQVDAIQMLSPEELQAIVSGQMHIGTAAPIVPEEAISPYKNWWDEEQEHQLLRLVKDEDYRKELLGTECLDWGRVASHFGRTESALRKKVWLLTTRPPGAKPPVQRGKKRKWTKEETAEMERIVTDEQYRIAEKIQDGMNGLISWDVVATRFTCTIAAAQRKYRMLQEKLKEAYGSPGIKKHREHHKKSLAYKWMIVAVMKDMPEHKGTALDIFKGIASNEDFFSQLDDTTAPGTTRVPRWKIQIRKTLSAEAIFVNTGKKVTRETVWKLDMDKVEQIKLRPKQRTGQSIII